METDDMNDDARDTSASRGSRLVAIVLAVMLAGCGAESHAPHLSDYKIKLTRPDGVLHNTYTIHSEDEPDVVVYDDGCLRVRSVRGHRLFWTQPFPVGWLVEVEPKAEQE
jgi:hypothetical protein